MENVKKILILSDKKPGHLNQSIAFAKIKGYEYDIVEIENISKIKKLLSYVLDFFGIYLNIFNLKLSISKYYAVVSTGSNTYYANRYIAQKLDTKSIAIMLPKGFRYSGFDFIIAQEHDSPPSLSNIIITPVNLSYNEPKGYISKDTLTKYVGIIIGGDNKIFTMKKETIKQTLDEVFEKYPEYKKLITTSRRTPKEIEKLCEEYEFDYELIYSKDPSVNPIPDFIDICDVLYITSDSTSMLSEAVANSDAKIEVVMLESNSVNTKYHKLIDIVRDTKSKIDLKSYLEAI
jgi:mitochondrial fission protein ELM1